MVRLIVQTIALIIADQAISFGVRKWLNHRNQKQVAVLQSSAANA